MRVLRSFSVMISVTISVSACNERAPKSDGRDTTSEPPASAARSADPEPLAPEPGSQREAGAVPFEFPAVKARSKQGDFVLAPSKGWIEEAFAKGADKQPFIFYGAWMLEPGEKASVLRTLPGQRVTIPNAMIIPVGTGESAKTGDIVLTAWASGSGMQRAIVVGGAPAEPSVRYLDLELDSPSGWGKKEDTLKPNTFHVLTKAGEPGTTVACKEGERHTRFVIVTEADGKLLGVGFAGKMKVLPRATCKNVPIAPKVKVGDTVFVPVIGAFTEAKVTKVDEKIGRVWVKHEFGGQDTDEAFAFTNVLPSL
jgi:hypothetical protein